MNSEREQVFMNMQAIFTANPGRGEMHSVASKCAMARLDLKHLRPRHPTREGRTDVFWPRESSAPNNEQKLTNTAQDHEYSTSSRIQHTLTNAAEARDSEQTLATASRSPGSEQKLP